MNLKIFNKENSSLIKTGECTVRVNATAGLISFSKEACSLLGINKETKLSFAQDEKNKEDWYVFEDKENGFAIRINTDSSGSDFNSVPLAKELINSVNAKYIAAGFKISKEFVESDGKKLYAIITVNPLNPREKK